MAKKCLINENAYKLRFFYLIYLQDFNAFNNNRIVYIFDPLIYCIYKHKICCQFKTMHIELC